MCTFFFEYACPRTNTRVHAFTQTHVHPLARALHPLFMRSRPLHMPSRFGEKRAAERPGAHLIHAMHVTRHTSHVTRHTSHVTRHMLQVQQQKSEYTEYFAYGQGMGARASLPFPLRTSHATPCTSFVVTRDVPRCVPRQEQNTQNGGQVLQSQYRLLRVRSHAFCLLPVSCFFSCHAARLHYDIFSYLIQVWMGRVFSFCSCE